MQTGGCSGGACQQANNRLQLTLPASLHQADKRSQPTLPASSHQAAAHTGGQLQLLPGEQPQQARTRQLPTQADSLQQRRRTCRPPNSSGTPPSRGVSFGCCGCCRPPLAQASTTARSAAAAALASVAALGVCLTSSVEARRSSWACRSGDLHEQSTRLACVCVCEWRGGEEGGGCLSVYTCTQVHLRLAILPILSVALLVHLLSVRAASGRAGRPKYFPMACVSMRAQVHASVCAHENAH